jgi:hypothetical protein
MASACDPEDLIAEIAPLEGWVSSVHTAADAEKIVQAEVWRRRRVGRGDQE